MPVAFGRLSLETHLTLSDNGEGMLGRTRLANIGANNCGQCYVQYAHNMLA